MKTITIALSALVLIGVASAQNARGTVNPGHETHVSNSIPGACSPCLWYAGDADATNPNYDAHVNEDITSSGALAQVWVPFVAAPDGNPLHKHVLISAITFNEIAAESSTNEPPDYTGMTYGFRTNVLSGNGGTLGKNGTCPSSIVVYTGNQPFGYIEYNFTCQLGKKAVKVPVGTIYWVNVTPSFTGSATYAAYLEDAIDIPALNQFGWGDVYWDTFFESVFFGESWELAQDELNYYAGFSVAIAGTNVD